MAVDQQITDLSNYSSPTSASDVLPIVDVTANSTKKITLTNFLAYIASFTQTLTNKSISGSTNTITDVSLTTSVTGTLPVANGGTGATTLAGASIATYTGTETFTNKRVTKRVGTQTNSSATPTINTDNYDLFSITGQTVDITSMTTNLSGTPTSGQSLIIQITGTASRAITWGTGFESSGNVTLPSTTSGTTMLSVGFIYNSATSKWTCVAYA